MMMSQREISGHFGSRKRRQIAQHARGWLQFQHAIRCDYHRPLTIHRAMKLNRVWRKGANEWQINLHSSLAYALMPGGFLFLGSSENLSQSDNLFTPIDKRHRIFQSLDLGDQRPRIAIPIEEMRGAAHGFDHHEMPQRMSKHNIRQRAEHQVMERHSPAHVVIRSEGDIVYYSSRTGRYFDTPRGAPNRQLFEIVRREDGRHERRGVERRVDDPTDPIHRN